MNIFNKIFNNTMEGGQEKEQKKFGHNIKVVIEFKRHQIAGKNPETGLSDDYLTSEGQAAAIADASEVSEETIKGFSTPKLRGQETADLMLQNVDDNVRVINKTKESLQGTAAENLSNNQKKDNVFNIRTRPELKATDNWLEIKPLADAWVKKQIEAGSKLDKLSLTVQWYLDNPEICREKGVLTAHETATEIAERAAVELEMTERFYDGSNVRLTNITHAPKIEPFLHEVIGFKNIEEIGGAVQMGENVKFIVSIDDNKEKNVKLLFRNKEYQVNEEQIRNLSQEYRDRLKSKS